MRLEPSAIFVYGTLMRSQERAALWPRAPLQVEFATTLGTLYDLGPYPALVAGNDVVAGELWYLRPEDMEVTLRTLDEIEGFEPGGESLYERRVVTCRNESGQMLPAQAYFFGRVGSLGSKTPVPPDEDGCCRWRG